MLTLQYVPYHDIDHLNSQARVKKLLKIVKENKVVILEGRLTKHEEAELIKATMELINESFKGIEIGTLHPERKDISFSERLRNKITSLFIGDRQGMTVIGSATLIKEIKQDPEQIQLFAGESRKKRG